MNSEDAVRQSAGISVLICTYRRNEKLAQLLQDVAGQSLLPREVVVVDNDASGGAREVVQAFAKGAAFDVVYDLQPVKNISLTRNRCVALARGAWLAFADDDERAGSGWLAEMQGCADRTQADGVVGPVLCQPPDDAPAWIRRGDFYALPRHRTGTRLPPNQMFIGNAFLRAELLRALEGPFSETYGLSGGEDSDLFSRLNQCGARILWCDEAVLTEAVAPSRLSWRWILMRAMSGGQIYGRVWRRGGYGALRPHTVLVFAAKAIAQLMVGALLAVLLLPFGRHRTMCALCVAAAAWGKLSALYGARHEQYRAAEPR